MNKNNKILINELKRTFPIYILGMIFHAFVIYILYKIPSIIGNILDLFIQGNIHNDIILKEVYCLLFYSVIMIIPRIIYRTLFFTKARISDTYLRSKVIEYLQSVKPEYYDKEEKGVFLAYLSKELLSIRKFLGNAFFNVARLVVAPIIGLIVIGRNFNIILMLSILPIFPIAIFFLYKLYKKQRELLEIERKVYLNLSKNIEQNTAGFNLIKLYNEQENQKKKFDEVNEQTYQSDINVGAIIYKMDMVSNILYAACYIIGFTVGLWLIKNGLLTIGELTAYISCITFAVSEIVHSIQPLLTGISNFKIATKRFNYFFGLDTYQKEGKVLERIEKIEIKNLSYSYYNNEILAIKDINITINKGEKIGIIGKVGSGKTTLMNIIAGFYEVSEKHVYINGVDINEYSQEAIFQNIGYAMQKNIIIDDTIKNNIDIVKEATDEKIEDISKKANILEDIYSMQDGFDTKLGENGAKISGGQKQRIQIARNLLNIRDVNIYDDTLSALDIETEKKIIQEIETQMQDKIFILVSNKISMMEKMDKIFLLVNGEIVESGTHEEMLEKSKLYNQLHAYEEVGDLA
ncbi:MAG: ABC transporter ATP-binding protein [Clostridia bacterium]|nr:ABC transporter ATP-binding protein [Clostridia bacterium]